MSSNTAPSRQQDTNIKVPLISKIAYGMGDVGCNFSWMFVGNFLHRCLRHQHGGSVPPDAGLPLLGCHQ